jgi:ribosomal protein L24E
MSEQRVCADCGTPLRPGDGPVLVQGKRFCSDYCADSYENGWPEPEDSFDHEEAGW